MIKSKVTVTQKVELTFEAGRDNVETYVNACGLLKVLLDDYKMRQEKSINEGEIILENHDRLVGYDISFDVYTVDRG